MTWMEAIIHVIKVAGRPLHYMEITEQIVTQNLRENVGATPSYSVAAQISMELKKGAQSRLARFSTGVYGLNQKQQPKNVVAELDRVDEVDAQDSVSIQAFGVYWERQAVDWKRANPRLYGQQFENADPIDFCDQRGIYVLFDHRDVVYVGRATQQSLGSRLRDHTVDRLRTRWDRFSWFGFCVVNPNGSLRQPPLASIGYSDVISIIEAVLIELVEPPQNRQQGKGLGGIEYLQRPDPALRRQHNQEILTLLAKTMDISDE